MKVEHKSIKAQGATFDDAAGSVRVLFSKLNVIDRDGDLTLPGAFKAGQEVRISAYNHASWGGALPVGKGAIHEEGDTAIFEGKFFLDTAAGAETYKTVKAMGDLQEWSYGFDVLDADSQTMGDQWVRTLKSLDVFEVSPVLLGAGIDTQTLDIKSASPAGKGRLIDHAASVLADVKALSARAHAVAELRAKDGRDISEETKGKLGETIAALEVALVDMKSLQAASQASAAPVVIMLARNRLRETAAVL